MATLDLAPDLICCNAAIGACARAGEPAQAQTVLREVLPTAWLGLGVLPTALLGLGVLPTAW
jgi:hypothetical protein